MNDQSLSKKNIFVVLGVARSGTSTIARGLKALGVDLGAALIQGNQKWNPKGFFEDSDVVYKVNGQAFKTLNFAPYGIQTLEKNQQTSEQLAAVKEDAITLLKQRFEKTHYWGFKDPSTVKLLAFWQAIFAELQLQEHYIIALRNPLSSAQSYQKLTGCDLELGLLLWLMYLFPAIEETHHKKRIVVSYESLLQAPVTQLDRIKMTLDIPNNADAMALSSYATEFLDKKLHHYTYDLNDLKKHTAVGVVPLVCEVYELFLKIANDEISFESEEFVSSWQTIKEALNNIQPVYAYLDIILKRNYQLKKELRTINKSILWKMLYPLRKIDNTLRERRRKIRATRRLEKAYG